MCKAIGEYTQCQIDVQVMPNGTVRFDVLGQKTKAAKDNIYKELCDVSFVLCNGSHSVIYRTCIAGNLCTVKVFVYFT